MELEKKQAIALMRYGSIAQLVNGLPDGYVSMSAYFQEVSRRGVRQPNGNVHHYDEKTIAKWYRAYLSGGFEALMPEDRSDEGSSRALDDDLQSRIRYFHEHYPRMSAAAIFRQLHSEGSVRKGELSESTVCRFIRQLDAQRHTPAGTQEMRRYERPHVNEVWCGDSSAGPYLKEGEGRKRRVFIIALIDDASRFVTGADLYFQDNFINLMAVMKSAVAKYGCPQMFNFDNGGAYKNQQMSLLAARIGSVVHYCKPYTPTAKAKIERWFRTLKDQWMATLDMHDFHTLQQLRESLLSYLHTYNLAAHSSLNGMSPQERFFSEPEKIRRLSQEHLERSFLLEIERRVSADCVVSIENTDYEVDARLARQRITLRYSPDRKDFFVVEPDGSLTPIRMLNKKDNAQVKRGKVRLSGGEH